MNSALPKVLPVLLGRTGITTSRIGLGTAGWPERVSTERAALALQSAFALGIRHLDCAAKYHTERQVGLALREVEVPRDLVVATKVCCYFDEELGTEYVSYHAGAAERSVERSLRLLGRERLEVVYVHDPAEENLHLVFRAGGVVETLIRLKEKGLVRHLGMASWDPRSLRRAVEHGAFDVIQSFHVNTLLNRSGRQGLYAFAEERGLGICDSGPYAGYILATGAVEGARYNYAPASPEVMAAVRRMEAVCTRKGVRLADAAFAFSLREPLVDVVVAASGNPEHIATWAAALDAALSDGDFREILEAAGPDVDVFDSKVARLQLHLW